MTISHPFGSRGCRASATLRQTSASLLSDPRTHRTISLHGGWWCPHGHHRPPLRGGCSQQATSQQWELLQLHAVDRGQCSNAGMRATLRRLEQWDADAAEQGDTPHREW